MQPNQRMKDPIKGKPPENFLDTLGHYSEPVYSMSDNLDLDLNSRKK